MKLFGFDVYIAGKYIVKDDFIADILGREKDFLPWAKGRFVCCLA